MSVRQVSHLPLNTVFKPSQHTLTILNCPFAHYFSKNIIVEENKLLGNVGEIWRNQRYVIRAAGITKVATVIQHREKCQGVKKIHYYQS
jgi:hypothetical protein